MRGNPVTATLDPNMFKYIEGLAKLHNLSLSKALAKVVEEHFEAAAKAVAKPKAKR